MQEQALQAMAQNVSEKSTSKVPSGKSCANEKVVNSSSSASQKGKGVIVDPVSIKTSVSAASKGKHLSPATKTAAFSANASVAGMSKPEPVKASKSISRPVTKPVRKPGRPSLKIPGISVQNGDQSLDAF